MNLKMNNELLGILYMILCQFSFATNDALVKILYQNYNDIFVLNQVIFLRGIFALFFIGFFLFFKKKFNFEFIFSSGKLRIRGLLEAIAAICFFIGIAKLPFAMVYVLLSLAPVILTVFSALILKEKVRWRRWTAVIIGFIGVIVVINPGKLEFGFYFIFPLLSAFFLSLRDIYTKKIKSKFHSLQIAFITCLVVTICFGILNVYKFFSFSLNEYIILFISSFFLSLGYIFSIATIKVALVSVTSTFRYTVILWGILYGYFLFNEIPNTNTYIGAFMIVVSGLIIISRQRKLGQLK
jgi:drug/metabolite transporter (DMT)-like permease